MFFIFFILFLFVGGNTFGSEVERFSVDRRENQAVSFHVFPKVTQLRRWVPLTFGGETDPAAGVSPIDLRDYSLLKTGRGSGIEVSLGADGTANQGQDCILQVWNVDASSLTPTATADFGKLPLIKKSLAYSVLHPLGFFDDNVWRYSAKGAKLKKIHSGNLRVECVGECTFDFEGQYDQLPLSKNGWFKFDYNLPPKSGWSIQIRARVRLPGLGIRSVDLWSPGISPDVGTANGILLDLYELLKNQFPQAEDALLTGIGVHFSKKGEEKDAGTDTSIHLGTIKIYPSRLGDSKPTLIVPFQDPAKMIDLLGVLKRQLPTNQGHLVLSSRPLGNSMGADDWRLLSSQSQNVPLAFVENPATLDSLDSKEYSDVLEQRLFFESKNLWTTGPTDIIVRSGEPGTPFVTYSVDLKRDPESELYLKVHFRFEKTSQSPLRLKVFGRNRDSSDRVESWLISNGQLVRLRDFDRISKIALLFEDSDVSSEDIPISTQIEDITLSRIKKTTIFKPRDVSLLTKQTFFDALPEHIGTSVAEPDGLQLLRTYQLKWTSREALRVDYSLSFPTDPKDEYFLRPHCASGTTESTSLLPLRFDGTLSLSDCQLSSLDIVVKKTGTPASTKINMDILRLEVSSLYDKSLSISHSLSREKDKARYAGTHLRINSPSSDWLRKLYPHRSQPSNLGFESIATVPLSFSEILGGGRTISLPEKLFEPGVHGFRAAGMSPFEDVSISEEFLKKLSEQASFREKEGSQRWPIAKILDKALSLLVLCFLICFFWFWSKSMVIVDKFLKRLKYLIWTEIILLNFAFGIYFSSQTHRVTTAASLLVLAYGLFVRYRFRDLLEQKYEFLRDRTKATPYLIGFLAMIVFCAINHILGRVGTMELAGVISYELFIVATVIDIWGCGDSFRPDAGRVS